MHSKMAAGNSTAGPFYRCYYCAFEGEDIDCLWHVADTHPNNVLKMRKLELNNSSGKLGYRTLDLKIIPHILESRNQCMQPYCTDGNVFIRVLPVPEKETYGMADLSIDDISDQSPWKKVLRTSTPHKVAPSSSLDTLNHHEDVEFIQEITDCLSSDVTTEEDYIPVILEPRDKDMFEIENATVSEPDTRLIQEITDCLPSVVTALKECNQIDSWMCFHRLIRDGNFPMENIAFHLFMDVCKFYSLENGGSMRYTPIVKRFWRIGYCLFHGKFLYFMSGPKNTGGTIDDVEYSLNPSEARINFAVPFKSIRKAVDEKDIHPGILANLVEKIAEQNTGLKSYKLCIDGKKINAGRSKKGGDVDLFGYEQSPTLEERKSRLSDELLDVQNACDSVTELEIRGKSALERLSDSDKDNIRSMLKTIILHLSKRICDLRKTKVNKTSVLDRLKLNSGHDWRKSKFAYVISALQTDVYDNSVVTSELLQSVNDLGHAVSVMNNVSHLYTKDSEVRLQNQVNYVHIHDVSSTEPENIQKETRYVKQGSDEWHAVRRSAKVTGSTLNNAVGLGSLKQQQIHYDSVVFDKPREEHTEDVQKRLKYGSENELHAISTLVTKVLPVYEPTLVYLEEGCYKWFIDNCAVVVSPDGSLREDRFSGAVYGIECKCPYPGKSFTTPVYYQIPRYYVTQLVSEMVAMQCEQLYFVCYSEESSTVFKVTHSPKLWEIVEEEVTAIYGSEHSTRPSKKSARSKVITEKIDVFLNENVSFLAEVPSVKGNKCNQSAGNDLLCHHARQGCSTKRSCSVKDLLEYIRRCQTNIERAYELNRTKASEFLGFMLSDTDRLSGPEMCHAIPVAYGLKGYSLPSATLRNMIDHVLKVCSEKGLYVPVCSFDGQWHKIAVVDRDDQPLTLLQLQKHVFNEVKRMSKSDIIKKISETNKVKCIGSKLPETVNVRRVDNCLVVDNGFRAYRIVVTPAISKLFNSKGKDQTVEDAIESHSGVSEIIGSLQSKSIDSDVVSQAIDVVSGSEGSQADFEDNKDTEECESVQTVFEDTNISGIRIDHETMEIDDEQSGVSTSDDKIAAIGTGETIQSLNTSDNRMKMWVVFNKEFPSCELSHDNFIEKFCNASTINSAFTKKQLLIIISPFTSFLSSNGVKCNKSQTKNVFVNLLSTMFGDGTQIQRKTKSRREPPSLVSLCKASVQRVPKQVLNCVYAQHIYPWKLQEWQSRNPFGPSMCLHNIPDVRPSSWYSAPEFNEELGHYVLIILDAYHQVCGLRRLFCSSGIPKAGISNKPIIDVAEKSEVNGCNLSTAVVKDLIDKQSIAYAVQTFSQQVEQCLREDGCENEANFCNLVRNWYCAEDEPGITAHERCVHRLSLRQWLLKDVRFDTFPPHGSYVKDIPVILYEGLILGVERKLQLYPLTKTGSYNVRSIGSLDIENFFSSFQDIDPRGTGVLRCDDIPAAIGVATELLDARLDPERGFYMQTSSKRVYPTNEMDTESEDATGMNESNPPTKDITIIKVRDHAFDKPQRCRGKHKRKSGRVSKNFEPSRNPLPVREHHKAYESKILPHVRRGLKLDDE